MALRRVARLAVAQRRRRLLCAQCARRRASARSACWWRSIRRRPSERWPALGRQLAMHVAAANPQYLDIASVPQRRSSASATCCASRRAPRGKADASSTDGRGPAAQILRGGRAARADLRRSTARAESARWSRRRPRTPARRSAIAGFVRFALGEGIERPTHRFRGRGRGAARSTERGAPRHSLGLPRASHVPPRDAERCDGRVDLVYHEPAARRARPVG